MNRERLKRAAGVKIGLAELNERFAYWGFACWMCGSPWEHIDHVKPIAKGGPHLLANLRPACAACNMKKGSAWSGVGNLDLFVSKSGQRVPDRRSAPDIESESTPRQML
ncbi:HNH endonuclease [uncultured Microbacterium sp.]|uniref:HNH endonuclease n=1 Tax=uncultured Microbacterium sp. TaxID=191216 RepID=UPI0037DD66FE